MSGINPIGKLVRILRCEASAHGENAGCVCYLIGGVERIAKQYWTPFAGSPTFHLLGREQRVRLSEVEIVEEENMPASPNITEIANHLSRQLIEIGAACQKANSFAVCTTDTHLRSVYEVYAEKTEAYLRKHFEPEEGASTSDISEADSAAAKRAKRRSAYKQKRNKQGHYILRFTTDKMYLIGPFNSRAAAGVWGTDYKGPLITDGRWATLTLSHDDAGVLPIYNPATGCVWP